MKKIAKVVHTATLEKRDPRREVFKMVLTHNATTHTTTNTPPAQALMNRPIRTLLPTINSPPTQQQTYIKERILQAKAKNKEYPDKRHHTKEKDANLGDTVLITQQKTTTKTPWNPTEYTIIAKQGRRITINHPQAGTKDRDVGDVKVIKLPNKTSKYPTRPTLQEEQWDMDIVWRRITPPTPPYQPPPPYHPPPLTPPPTPPDTYTQMTKPTTDAICRSRWAPDH